MFSCVAEKKTGLYVRSLNLLTFSVLTSFAFLIYLHSIIGLIFISLATDRILRPHPITSLMPFSMTSIGTLDGCHSSVVSNHSIKKKNTQLA